MLHRFFADATPSILHTVQKLFFTFKLGKITEMVVLKADAN